MLRGRPLLARHIVAEAFGDEITAACGTREQYPLQSDGAPDAAGQPGDDERKAGGVEGLGDDGEGALLGAVLQRRQQVVAVGEQDLDEEKNEDDAVRRELAGPALLGSGRVERPAVASMLFMAV